MKNFSRHPQTYERTARANHHRIASRIISEANKLQEGFGYGNHPTRSRSGGRDRAPSNQSGSERMPRKMAHEDERRRPEGSEEA